MSTSTISTSGDDRHASIHVGDHVDVIIRGARVVDHRDGTLTVDIATAPAMPWAVDLPTPGTYDAAVTIERLAPSWWPPAPGRVIRISDRRTGVVRTSWACLRGGELRLVDELGRELHAGLAIREYLAAGLDVELVELAPAGQHVEDVIAEAGAEQDNDRCGASSFSEPHGWVPPVDDTDRDGYPEYERCGQPAFSEIHRAPKCGGCGADTWLTTDEVKHKRDCPHLVAKHLDAAEQDGGVR